MKFKSILLLFKDLIVVDAQESNIYHEIKRLLTSVFTCEILNLNMYDNIKYNEICLDDIYFGTEAKNIDEDTGINYSFYTFLRPAKFKNKIKNVKTPILKALSKDLKTKIQILDSEY